MEQEIKVEPSEKLAYWTGVIQTDGCLHKRKECESWRIEFGVAEKSLPMLEKFRDTTKEIFGIDSKITKKCEGVWVWHSTVTKLLESFKTLSIEFDDPPKPPVWCLEKPAFLGAYLAGVIDGDGDIRIKRPKYPQCAIRVTSGTPQIELQDIIKKRLKCGSSIRKTFRKAHVIEEGRLIEGVSFSLEFLLSSITKDFIKDFLLPWLQIPHKRERIESYLKLKEFMNRQN